MYYQQQHQSSMSIRHRQSQDWSHLWIIHQTTVVMVDVILYILVFLEAILQQDMLKTPSNINSFNIMPDEAWLILFLVITIYHLFWIIQMHQIPFHKIIFRLFPATKIVLYGEFLNAILTLICLTLMYFTNRERYSEFLFMYIIVQTSVYLNQIITFWDVRTLCGIGGINKIIIS